MVIRDGASSIELTPREVGAAGTPAEGDLGINVAATAGVTAVGGPFAGRNDTVWIGRDDWASFLEDLRELDRTRHGEAHVIAMSPAEFQLTVFATDAAGHLAADGWVGREYAARNEVAHDRVCFSVEIDPGVFPQLLRQFEGLDLGG
jgi:hypothetical protein